jgi:glycerol dehydrogenase-like iron-containing ADH family enzyme
LIETSAHKIATALEAPNENHQPMHGDSVHPYPYFSLELSPKLELAQWGGK